MRCQIWDHQTRQDSAFEVSLNFIAEQGNAWRNSSGRPGIREPCLRIRYINSISLRQSSYPWTIWDILCSICLRGVKTLTAILLYNWLNIIQYGGFVEYPEFIRDCSIRCASNWHISNNLNQTWRFRHTWQHGSPSQISLSQFHTNNFDQDVQPRQILTREYMALRNLN